MELGNMIFGNSRGEYEVPRDARWEGELLRLFDSYSEPSNNSRGVEFENDTFFVFPYYWGDCTCGYDELERNWSDENFHQEGCYQDLLQKNMNYWLEKHPEPNQELWKNWYTQKRKYADKVYDKLCKQFNLDRELGCAAHCTCDYEERWKSFINNNGHKEFCPIIKPNFYYKKTGFYIKWYKYPLRDSYMNKDLKITEFRKIIEDCIKSIEIKL